MTPTQFKNLREGLFLSQDDLATIFGHNDAKDIQQFESGEAPIHKDAANLLAALEGYVQRAALEASELYAEKSEEFGKPITVDLFRYESDTDFSLNKPHDFSLLKSHKVHAAMVDRVRQHLENLGANVVVEIFKP